MNRDAIYSKAELGKRLHRYCWDEDRLLPVRLFAKECGIQPRYFRMIFRYQIHPCPDWLQIRASKLLRDWEDGNLKVMQNAKGTMKLEYRETPKPRLKPACQLVFTPSGIGLKIAIINQSDYGDKAGLFNAPPRLPLSGARPVRKFGRRL